jgi:hypothetical protein
MRFCPCDLSDEGIDILSSYLTCIFTLSNESSLLRDVDVRKLDEEGSLSWLLWLVAAEAAVPTLN